MPFTGDSKCPRSRGTLRSESSTCEGDSPDFHRIPARFGTSDPEITAIPESEGRRPPIRRTSGRPLKTAVSVPRRVAGRPFRPPRLVAGTILPPFVDMIFRRRIFGPNNWFDGLALQRPPSIRPCHDSTMTAQMAGFVGRLPPVRLRCDDDSRQHQNGDDRAPLPS